MKGEVLHRVHGTIAPRTPFTSPFMGEVGRGLSASSRRFGCAFAQYLPEEEGALKSDLDYFKLSAKKSTSDPSTSAVTAGWSL